MADFTALNAWAEELITSERLMNAEICIVRHGDTVFSCQHGHMDLARQRPVLENSIFRIYSMTKPIVAVAIMQLIEEGKLKVTDPVSKFISTFTNQFVVDSQGNRVPASRDITVHDLLTHTAGLTYGGPDHPPVSTSYREKGIDFSTPYADLAEMVAHVGTCDLYYQPGSRWVYSVANDVLGRVIEVASGLTLDQFLEKRIFEPLGMTDTAFHVSADRQSRFVGNFGYDSAGQLEDISDGSNDRFLKSGTLLSGGGGLVSTARDYMTFAKMMLANGTLDVTRILEPASVELMTRNHLPGDLTSMGCAVHSTMSMTGIGYGYGVAVTIDQDQTSMSCSNGDYGWAGVANTYFWIDPEKDMVVLFLSQQMPASDMPIRADLRSLVYTSLR